LRRILQGKVIPIVEDLAPGGGFDTYFRMIAKHMGDTFQAIPTFLVEKMTGGVKEGFATIVQLPRSQSLSSAPGAMSKIAINPTTATV
jgi:tripartite-type tricarboxylate transporter receptor subunit TctC